MPRFEVKKPYASVVYYDNEKQRFMVGTEIVSIMNVAAEACAAIEALLDEKPMLAAKVCGSTTLGNLRAELRSALGLVK